jgi:hypothetical protein
MMPPRDGRWGWFWGTRIEDVSGRLFRFYGLAIGRIGIGVLTHPSDDA